MTCIQIRIKHVPTQKLVALAAPTVQFCKQQHIPCIINDDAEAAALLQADGVHVGQSDCSIQQARAILGKSACIGVSAHNLEEARMAQQGGADYIGCGAVFGSATKQDATPLSRETLRTICQGVSIPVVAIGGITAQNVQQLAGSGIQGIAVVSAIFGQPDKTEAARQMHQLANQICGGAQ